MPRRPTPDAREHILAAAARLFYDHGVHAVGLQQVIDEYGCGKNLLYREFPSKDELVVAWLERCHAEWEARIDAVSESMAGDPAGQHVAIVEDAADTGVPCATRASSSPSPTTPPTASLSSASPAYAPGSAISPPKRVHAIRTPSPTG